MFNLAVDEEHVTLAFGLRWIEALAARFEHIDVVTMTAGRHRLPANVRVWSLGRERGYSELRRAVRFYRVTWRILRERPIAVVFTHMVPIFAVLFWPLARLMGVKNVLWYAHGATPPDLRLAHRLVDRVVSSTPEGFRLPSQKVSFLGQGIDAHTFRFVSRPAHTNFQIVSVGRLSPSKGLDVLIEALAELPTGANWHLTIVGDGTSDDERAYADALRRGARQKLGDERVTFTGRLDPPEIVPLLARADAFVNLSTTGSLDKAIVEAMASGCPVLSSNDAFRSIALASGFAECILESTPEAVRAGLDRVLGMDLEERRELGRRQLAVAIRDHTLAKLIESLHGILCQEARPARA